MSRLLHDDAKMHATSARHYNVLENWREMKYFDPDSRPPDFILYVTTKSSFCVKITEMTMSGIVLSYKMSFYHIRRSGGKVIFLGNIVHCLSKIL